MILETERLTLRKITYKDKDDLFRFLGDIEVLYAWGHIYPYEEINSWIDTNTKRYEEYNMGYYGVALKGTENIIGVCGTLKEKVNNKEEVELAYIFNKEYWGRGYAVEASLGCIDYCFENFDVPEIVAQIKYDNISSQKVVKKCGFEKHSEFIKHYCGEDLLHYEYKLSKEEK